MGAAGPTPDLTRPSVLWVIASLESIRALCEPIPPIDVTLHDEAIRVADRYGIAFYDALMIAAALSVGCKTFWSDDMQHGFLVDGKLTIANPFR